MTSTLYVVPEDHAHEAFEWPEAATFKLPVKGVFGRVLCDTDGTIGDPSWMSPDTALEIVEECEKLDHLYTSDPKDLAKIKKWATAGKHLFADWRH